MILVVGATGILGGMITQRLLEEGKDVRILVRHNSPAEELAIQRMATSPRLLIASGARPVYGDLKDRDSLDKACAGIEVVITTANSAMRGGEDNVDTVDRQGNRNLIEAAKAANVKQFIFTSFLGADVNSTVLLFQAKAETEARLVESGMPYTILTPNYFMESWIGMIVGIPLQASQPITLVGEGQRLHSIISITDVVSFAVAAVNHPAAINQRLVLGGPEPLSWRGIANSFGQILGQEIPIRFVAPGEPIPGLPEIVPPVLAAMETYDSSIPMDETARAFGVEQTTLTSFIHRTVGIPGG
ncbi:MAG: SDR family oxidoreductase [Chloroflexi bacterium]|nr:SDR family oxidoreductase [Chloroflexota bacterium]